MMKILLLGAAAQAFAVGSTHRQLSLRHRRRPPLGATAREEQQSWDDLENGSPRCLLPLLRSVAWYDQRLRHSPLLTKSVSNGFASALGDFLAQQITSSGPLDRRRCFAWALTGWFYFGPVLHTWYNFLQNWEHRMIKNGEGKVGAVLWQIAFNQFIGATVVNSVFLYWMASTKMLLNSALDRTAVDFASAFAFATTQMSTTFPTMMLLNWFFWPGPTYINLYLIPHRWRVLFSNSVSVLWKCIVSIVTNK